MAIEIGNPREIGLQLKPCILAGLAVLASMSDAMAQTLMGAQMLVQVVTYDDPANPMLESEVYSALIGPGAEFGLDREGHPFIDIVPVSIDIGDSGVSFSYVVTEAKGGFTPAVFNGYILTIAPCAEMAEPRLTAAVDIGLTPDRIAAEDNQLFINVAGLSYQPSTRIDIAFETRACPVS